MRKLITVLILLFFGITLKAQQSNHKPLTWTKGHEAVVLWAVYNSPILKSSNEKTRRYYCECYVKGLKETYPKGISHNVPTGVQDSISNKCKELIKVNASLLQN